MNEIISWMTGWFGWNGNTITIITLIIVSSIEISPISWNPIKSILTAISRALMKETTKMIKGYVEDFTCEMRIVKDDITKVDEKLTKVDENLTNQVREIKWDQVTTKVSTLKKNILQFAGNCSMDDRDPHTLEHYQNIMDEMEEYDRLITMYNIPNGVFKTNKAFIEECYSCHQRHNSFALPGGIHHATGQQRCHEEH